MMKKVFFIVVLFVACFSFAQEESPVFKGGEWLKFRMSYSGFLKAGEAELSLKEKTLNGKKVLHAIGKGRTANVIGWFFKVRDKYQSYFDIETGLPYLFKRDVNEGGHKIKRDISFKDGKAYIKDYISNKNSEAEAVDVHDMISTFYYLRKVNVKDLKKNKEIDIDMFFDGKTFPFKLKFLGEEILKTKFGKLKTLKFRPLVKSGRVFKAQESVTVWVTADDNKIPVKMHAELSVGSLRAELSAYKGLANPFEIIFD